MDSDRASVPADANPTRTVKAVALILLSAFGVGLVGLILGGSLAHAPGLAAETFFGMLSTAILANGMSDLFMPTRLLPNMIVLRRWLWVSLASGLAMIRYLREAADFGSGKLIVCIAIGVGLAAFLVWWLAAARRQHLLLTSQLEKPR